MDKISIIIPIYNNERYLRKCLQSVQSQTYSNIEVIMVNDGSTDNSEQICLEFVQSDERFKYIYQSNAGVSSARNVGLDASTGKYIGFVDSDDWIADDMYESLYNLINSTSACVAIGGFFYEGEWDKPQPEYDNQIKYFTAEEAINELLEGSSFKGELCNKLFKGSCFNGVRLNKEIYTSEDLVVVCKIFCKCDEIVFQNIPLYHYQYNADSTCHIKFNERHWSLQNACREICNVIESYQPKNLVSAQRFLIGCNISLAVTLCKIKMLNKENYDRIKNEIRQIKDKKVKRTLHRKMKLSMQIFNTSRVLFIIFRYFVVKSKQRGD